MAYTKVKPLMVASFPSSRLTGAFGAISGANLTGLGDGIDTKSASSDPAINTNPAAVGHTWLNKTSGEMFICIDATAGANTWINMGSDNADVGKVFGGRGLGTVAGYTAGGYATTTFHKDTVDKFSIPNPSGTATDHANLTNGQTAPSGSCSKTDGYIIGGQTKGYGSNPPDNANWTKIQKYNFAAANTVSQPGDISIGTYGAAGHSSSTNGYVSGGVSSVAATTRIERFLFSSETSVTDGGNLVYARRLSNCGHSSETYGYASTGESPTADYIEAFSFATDSSSTSHGDLTVARYSSAGISSDTHGYVAGGNGPLTNRIDRFSFASAGNATDVGDLSEAKASSAGVSGSTKGYVSGAYQATSGGAGQGRIDEFAHASSVNATNVATLFDPRGYATGTQY